MASKNKSCQGRDVFGRMNFLYQASNLMAGKNDILSTYYGNLCKSIGKRAVLRMDPDIKRTLCRKCGIYLTPGITANIDFLEKDEKMFMVECKNCRYKRNFVVNPKYNFWLENQKSIVETFHSGENYEEKHNRLPINNKRKSEE